MNLRRLSTIAPWILLIAIGCGGGGGGGSGSATSDTTTPTVVGRMPAPGATDVAVGSAVSATFSEGMDPATITGATFTLGGPSGPVAGLVSYAGGTATFTPSAALAYATTYTATVTTAARDAAGNALATAMIWSFSTAAAPDTTPPTVVGRMPAPGATDVAVGSAVSATFSEGMDPATITGATFTLGGPSGPVEGLVSYAGGTATFTPSAALAYATTYTATVTTGAADLAGNALVAQDSWSFTTITPLPVADAGPNQDVTTGTNVVLDGTGSTPALGSSLSYFWQLVTRPAGSVSELSDPTSPGPSFVADRDGVYVINLLVSDGIETSFYSSVTVIAKPPIEVHFVIFGGSLTSDSLCYFHGNIQIGYLWYFESCQMYGYAGNRLKIAVVNNTGSSVSLSTLMVRWPNWFTQAFTIAPGSETIPSKSYRSYGIDLYTFLQVSGALAEVEVDGLGVFGGYYKMTFDSW